MNNVTPEPSGSFSGNGRRRRGFGGDIEEGVYQGCPLNSEDCPFRNVHSSCSVFTESRAPMPEGNDTNAQRPENDAVFSESAAAPSEATSGGDDTTNEEVVPNVSAAIGVSYC